jgi:hypothetical protein
LAYSIPLFIFISLSFMLCLSAAEKKALIKKAVPKKLRETG